MSIWAHVSYTNICMAGIVACLHLIMWARTVTSGSAGGWRFLLNWGSVKVIVAFLKSIVCLILLMPELVGLVNRFQTYVAVPRSWALTYVCGTFVKAVCDMHLVIFRFYSKAGPLLVAPVWNYSKYSWRIPKGMWEIIGFYQVTAALEYWKVFNVLLQADFWLHSFM